MEVYGNVITALNDYQNETNTAKELCVMEFFTFDEKVLLQTVVEGQCYRKIKSYSEQLMTVEVTFENGCISEPHSHVHEQITYCLEGSFRFHVGEESQIISAGDTVYMPSNVIHNCELLSVTGKLLDVFTPMRKDFL